MKKAIIGIATVLCLIMGFAVCGPEKYPSPGSMPGVSVAKAFVSQNAAGAPMLYQQPDQDASIFSWTSMVFLSAAVIGVVSFRRNTSA